MIDTLTLLSWVAYCGRLLAALMLIWAVTTGLLLVVREPEWRTRRLVGTSLLRAAGPIVLSWFALAMAPALWVAATDATVTGMAVVIEAVSIVVPTLAGYALVIALAARLAIPLRRFTLRLDAA